MSNGAISNHGDNSGTYSLVQFESGELVNRIEGSLVASLFAH